MKALRAALLVLTAVIVTGCVVRTRPAARNNYHCHPGVPRICHNVVHR